MRGKFSSIAALLAALMLVVTLAPLANSELVVAIDVPDTLVLPVTIRDFHGCNWAGGDGYVGHQDFENGAGDDRGIVQTTLGGDKKPVYAGGNGTLTTHGKIYFDQWYNDTPGVNMRMDTTLTFTWDGSKYVYDKPEFFPIDNQLLGNDDRSHNYHFTLELHTIFTYQGGEEFNFTGDDDVWVFINNKLVIDLGGAHHAESASVRLDELGLIKGNSYAFDLFFAERHTVTSNFKAEGVPFLSQYIYSIKFICGKASSVELGVEPADYATAINIHNFLEETVALKHKVVLASFGGTPAEMVTPYMYNVSLGPNIAMEIDCVDIRDLLESSLPPPPIIKPLTGEFFGGFFDEFLGGFLGGFFDGGSSQPSQPQPQLQLPSFLKGFVVIESPQPLNIVAVYTAKAGGEVSIDVEQISPVASP